MILVKGATPEDSVLQVSPSEFAALTTTTTDADHDALFDADTLAYLRDECHYGTDQAISLRMEVSLEDPAPVEG